MGGWRCSYRNCSMRSDGKTHMFHYPVFDKVRCHQWLVNAGRLDFLNLKVSQLKNRVICQHHFANEHFMNFKRDKLTFDAVPSINGPFCDASEGLDKSLEETTNSLSIIFDDIENEYMTLNDKRANYSTKYADFLTSNELGDIDISTYVPEHNVFNKNKDPVRKIPAGTNNNSKPYCDIDISTYVPEHNVFNKNKDPARKMPASTNNNSKSYLNTRTIEIKDVKSIDIGHETEPNLAIKATVKSNKASVTPDINKKYQTQPIQVVPPYKTKPNQAQVEENVLEIELPPGFINSNALVTEETKDILFTGDNLYQLYASADNRGIMSTPKLLNKEAKVKILSEKRISEPLALPTGHLEPVSPSMVLPILQRKPASPPLLLPTLQKKPMMPQIVTNEDLSKNQEILLENKIPQPVPIASNKYVKKRIVKEGKVDLDNKSNNPRISLLKNKITPERVAEIEEKRKFNMKLRDIIESFLDKLDEQDKEIKDSNDVSNQPSKHKGKCLSNQPKSVNQAEQEKASLEARLKKMEDTLLSKIDQNSQKITELKNTIVHKDKVQKKSFGTQTTIETECQKKRLYKEISEYLSPDAKSLIYEELFINKFVKAAPAKRKRRR